ncbi:hypothetical protein ACF09H_40605 [Streptomyces sp. NPDC014983]|uniref:hypothetical protein n=1 Tax=Streptomyces sp. NPDC014983 TaxID=3364933 RepID=UPI0036F5EABD
MIRARLVSATGEPPGPAEKAVKTRHETLDALTDSGMLKDAVTAATHLSAAGRTPSAVHVRRLYVRHTVPLKVVTERNGLPREKRPPAARLIAPRGVTGRLHLLLLFAAACQAAPGQKWHHTIPIEHGRDQPVSLERLVCALARHRGGTAYVASPRTNKLRQITQALKTLNDQYLVDLPHRGEYLPFRDFTLLCDSGHSTDNAHIPYRVPKKNEPYVDIPAAFFTRGWVHLLTPSEITAYLMWLDVNQHSEHDEPYVTGAVRAGAYGLTREAYETHQALQAFGLIDVTPDPDRHGDGKYAGYHPDSRLPPCHRVTVTPDGLLEDAADRIGETLNWYAATGDWVRPLRLRRT